MPKSAAERKRDQRARDKLPGGMFERTYRATEEEHEALAKKLKALRAKIRKALEKYKLTDKGE